jgi:methionine-S-sulfoxide reductase
MAIFGFGKKVMLPQPEEALPGRSTPMPVPEKHYVNGSRLTPPFPEGMELAMFGMGCFWGAERKFWQMPGVYSTAVGYAAGFTPNPTYQEVCTGMTGHNEVVRVVFDPQQVSYSDLLKTFWENHNPTQGMRQGNDVGTQYRSGIYVYSPQQTAIGGTISGCLPKGTECRWLWHHHHGNFGCAGVLLRRSLPPAVPGKKSWGLLRVRGYGDRLSRGCCYRIRLS